MFEYSLQRIVLVVPRGAAQSAIELRQREAKTMRARAQSCAEANAYAMSMTAVVISDPLIMTSDKIPANVLKVLDETPVGHLTPSEVTKRGVEMVALCARRPATTH